MEMGFENIAEIRQLGETMETSKEKWHLENETWRWFLKTDFNFN